MATTTASSSVHVEPVTARGDRKAFIDFPYSFYADDYPAWVPPLRTEVKDTIDTSKNAFFEHGEMQLFLAKNRRGAVVGRIAAIVNGMHLQKYDDDTGFFGFFECVDDYAVAEQLLDTAARWLREQGLTRMRGPTNPSLNDTAGLLVDGFDAEPSILMPYNPPYHADYLERYGFERVMTMWAYYVHKKYVQTDKLKRGVELVRRRTPGLELRTIDMDRYREEAQTILDIYNDAWADNWGHVPMTDAEFDQLADALKQIVEPEIVYILEHEGTPVAFSIALPNLNQVLRHIDDGRLFPFGLPKLLAYAKFGEIYECRMPLMGVRKAYQGRALDSILVYETIKRGPKNGFDACEMSWVLDTNDRLINSLESMGGVVDKEYAMYETTVARGE
jgi:GNAT superfamily N-acetyltransferase